MKLSFCCISLKADFIFEGLSGSPVASSESVPATLPMYIPKVIVYNFVSIIATNVCICSVAVFEAHHCPTCKMLFEIQINKLSHHSQSCMYIVLGYAFL